MSNAKKINPNLKKKSALRENIEAVLWAVGLALLIRWLVIEPYKIPTGSMNPTLRGIEHDENGEKTHGGDKILANKFIYFFKEPQRGDIVIFRTKGIQGIDPRKKDFVKRLIGLPGDTVEVRRGHVYINGDQLTEPEIFQKINYESRGRYATAGHPVKIPEESYFFMGDNSGNSNDGRYWGFVPEDNIKGKALMIYWPPSRWSILQ